MACLGAPPGHADDATPPCHRLDDLVAAALPGHPRVLAAQGEQRARKSDVEAGEAASNPKFSVGMEAASIEGPYGLGSTPSFGPYAKASKLLWDGGKVDADVHRRELTAEAGRLDVDAVRNDIATGITDAYVELLRQRLLLDAADAYMAGVERIVGKMEQTVRIDPGRRADLELARARRSTAQSNRSAVAIAQADAALRLRRYLAHTAAAPALSTDACYRPPAFSSGLPASLDQARADAITHNPQMITARKNLEALRQQARLEAIKGRPSANLELIARSVRDTTGDTDYLGQLEVRITGNWDAYDGGAVAATSKAARQRVTAAEGTLDAQRQELEAVMLQAWQQMTERRKRTPALEQHLAQTQQVRNDAEEQFMAGRRSLLDLLNFENDVFNAHQLWVANQADLLLAEATLLATLGVLPGNAP